MDIIRPGKNDSIDSLFDPAVMQSITAVCKEGGIVALSFWLMILNNNDIKYRLGDSSGTNDLGTGMSIRNYFAFPVV